MGVFLAKIDQNYPGTFTCSETLVSMEADTRVHTDTRGLGRLVSMEADTRVHADTRGLGRLDRLSGVYCHCSGGPSQDERTDTLIYFFIRLKPI